MSKLKQTYSVERGFISKLVEVGDMKLLKDLQIKPSFLTGDNRRVFQYISEHFKNTGEVPTPRIIAVTAIIASNYIKVKLLISIFFKLYQQSYI